jgi:hypothetical protein
MTMMPPESVVPIGSATPKPCAIDDDFSIRAAEERRSLSLQYWKCSFPPGIKAARTLGLQHWP